MNDSSIHRTFTAALDALVEEIKRDRSILAVILCGSLSHDTVWARSDIDLVLVTVDDRKAACRDVALFADGVNVHAFLFQRSEFRATVEGTVRNEFFHSLLAHGRLLYTHDDTIADLCAGLAAVGDRDSRLQMLHAACNALPPIYKARKWFTTRGDLEYTALWILYAATPLAMIEVVGARQLAGREVIIQAMKLNPAFFKVVYSGLLNAKKTRTAVAAALEAADSYIAGKAPVLFSPVVEYLREAGEVRSASDIEHHFDRSFGIRGVTTACEYLADQGIIGKASSPVHLTKKSNVEVQELAFFHTQDPVHASD